MLGESLLAIVDPIMDTAVDMFEYKYVLQKRLEILRGLLADNAGDLGNYPVSTLQYMQITNPDPILQRRVSLRLILLSQCDDIIETLGVLDRKMMRVAIRAESSFEGVMGHNIISDEVKEQNFIDAVGESIKFVDAGTSSNSSQGQGQILNMSDYLARPVEIYEADITGAAQSIKLSVWDLFTKQPSVRAKIRNYAYLRGNLHVRIAISGTPFHFGRMLVSYQPYGVYNPNLTNLATMLATTSSARPLVLNYLSQAPGAVVMNVNENRPVEIICPFISTKPMHRLFNFATTAIAAGTSFDDLADAGDLYIYTLNVIGSVSTAPADVTMQVYAWMTDTELGTNTATQMAITTESNFSDEREVGVVENIASRGVQIAKALSSVPFLGTFAKASDIVLSGVKNLAAMFGWSKPVIIQNTGLMKNLPFTNGALTIGDDTNFRVTLDPKQELTVDPRVAGSQEDDMAIAAIAGRSSYWRTFTWAYNSPIMANPIFVGRVSPNLVTYVTSVNNYIQPTALAYSAFPFSFWRGDIIFRFEIVCSQYHRGKLAIFYEPNASQMTLINADLSFNKQFLRVIDIQQTQTFEVSVKWAAYRAWLKLNSAGAAVLNNSPTYTGTENQGYINGYIGITAFTQLTSPSATPSVDINVYVRSENIQYNGLSTYNMPTQRKVLSSLSIQAESSFSEGVSSDESYSSMQGAISTKDVSLLALNESSASTQHICEEHFGEQPISFRTLLKRYTTHAFYALSTVASGIHYLELVANVYPDNNLQYGAVSVNYNDLYSYLRYAYLGIRGGVRFRVRCVGVNGQTEQMQVKMSLSSPTTSTSEAINWLSTSIGAPALLSGTASYVPNTNGGFEAEFPFYSNNLWVFSFVDGLTGGAGTDNMSDLWFRQFRFTSDFASSSTLTAQTVMSEFATAEDFSFLRFQGAPFYSADPVS